MSATSPGFGELIGHLAHDSAALVREELALAKQETKEALGAFFARLAMVAVGALLALLALSAMTASAVIGLGHEIGYGTSALAVGAALAVVGGVILGVGIRRLKRVSLKPQQTIETLEEGKRWMKELT